MVMVETYLSSGSLEERERFCKYVHINMLLHPNFYLMVAGTTSEVYSMLTHEKVGTLFLSWRGNEVEIRTDCKLLLNDELLKKLESNKYKVVVK